MNPKGGTPPEEHRFSSANQPSSQGRTPTKWLREFLNAARDKSPEGRTRREEIALHLFEIATSWKILHFGKDIEVASGRDAVEAAKLFFQYDMGKAPAPVEVTSPDGSMSPGGIASAKTTAELRGAIAKALGVELKGEPSASGEDQPNQEPQEEPKDGDASSASAVQPGGADQ